MYKSAGDIAYGVLIKLARKDTVGTEVYGNTLKFDQVSHRSAAEGKVAVPPEFKKALPQKYHSKIDTNVEHYSRKTPAGDGSTITYHTLEMPLDEAKEVAKTNKHMHSYIQQALKSN